MFRPNYVLNNASNKFKYKLCLNLNATNYIEDYINIIDVNNAEDLINMKILLLYKDEHIIRLIIKKYMEKHETISNDLLNSIMKNSNAISFIKAYKDEISKMSCFCSLCRNTNPDVIPIITQFTNKFKKCCWEVLCSNPNAFPIINNSKTLSKISGYNAWCFLCANSNPDIIALIGNHIDKLDQFCWRTLCKNPCPQIIPIIEHNLDKIDKYYCWSYLCSNTNAIHIIKERLDNIITKPEYFNIITPTPNSVLLNYSVLLNLCLNINALDLIEKYEDKLDLLLLEQLSCLRNSHAIRIVKRNVDKLNYECWTRLWQNSFAFEIIEQHLNLLDYYQAWHYLCSNTNPNVISILERNLEKIKNEHCFVALGSNKNAIHLYYLFLKYDYKSMSNAIKEFNKELNDYVFHPTRLLNMSKQYNMSFIQYHSILDGTDELYY